MRVAREVVVPAPAGQVGEWVRDVSRWPLLFPGTLHVEVLETAEAGDRLRIWAADAEAARKAVAGEPGQEVVRTWTARRTFGPGSITFRQEEPAPPLTAMGGTWRFHDHAEGCRAGLAHEVDGDLAGHAWVAPMIERVTAGQLDALRAAPAASLFDESAVARVPAEAAVPSGMDSDRIPVAPDAFLVPERLTVGLVLPGGRLVAKSLRPPPALRAMTGEWTVLPGPGGDATVEFRRRALLACSPRAAHRVRAVLARDVRDRLRQVEPV